MLIKDIIAKTGNNDVVAEIIEIGPIREFEKEGKQGRVATATIKDESGIIQLSLWNEQIDQVEINDRIEVKNAWCDEWKEELKLSTGKFGTIKVLSSNEKLSHFSDVKSEEDTETSSEDLSKDDIIYPEEFLDADENI
ncbi:hypothetical protein C0585_00810 [Candidatus Woesearchaeota archaeon]|nr:MAG: hypothetical protein C0585_00810 [Candidatus Woesearchaeota archaeon]